MRLTEQTFDPFVPYDPPTPKATPEQKSEALIKIASRCGGIESDDTLILAAMLGIKVVRRA